MTWKMVNFAAKLRKNRHSLNPVCGRSCIKHSKNLKNPVKTMRDCVEVLSPHHSLAVYRNGLAVLVT